MGSSFDGLISAHATDSSILHPALLKFVSAKQARGPIESSSRPTPVFVVLQLFLLPIDDQPRRTIKCMYVAHFHHQKSNLNITPYIHSQLHKGPRNRHRSRHLPSLPYHSRKCWPTHPSCDVRICQNGQASSDTIERMCDWNSIRDIQLPTVSLIQHPLVRTTSKIWGLPDYMRGKNVVLSRTTTYVWLRRFYYMAYPRCMRHPLQHLRKSVVNPGSYIF